jgi:pyruvate/2-oxoglutarate dehydrogenase complex dihydrolipoamide dehydrogenase (E3) component
MQADAIVIGSGQGGVALAVDLARSGKRVVLFERGRFGGTCINDGCTPSKAFLAAAHGAGRARLLAPLGVRAEITVDFGALMARVRSIRDSFERGVERSLAVAKVEVIKAQAAFTAPRAISGGGVTVTAPVVIINTGGAASVPDITGLHGMPFLTNENFFELRDLPKRLLVMGGGYIGLELGQGMARLGSQVSIIDPSARVLAREEADVSAALAQSLTRDGVRLHLERKVVAVSFKDGLFSLTLDDRTELAGEALLVAVGRHANSAALNASAGGIALDAHGYVAIDDHFRTSSPGVYAIGDVAGQPAFTHVSWEDYRRVKAILAGEMRTRDDRVLAYSTFTEPQVARVGLDVAAAEQKGIKARCVTLGMDRIARAIEWGHDLGFYRLLVDERDDTIIGATLVGYEAGEVVHVILAHMQAKSTWHLLDESVHIHPTYAEALPSLARLLAP